MPNLLAHPTHVPVPSIFTAEDLTKRYGPSTVLDSFGFRVEPNSVVGLVGENGAGKSTLLNILTGIVRPGRGRMTLHGGAFAPSDYGEALPRGLSRVFQEQSLIQNIPVYENLVLGHEAYFDRAGQFVDKSSMIAAAERIVSEAGIDVDVRRRTGAYDFSTRQSIEIARACLAAVVIAGKTSPLVLLDEPTSALDRRGEEAFFRLVAKIRTIGAILFVSHRLSEVLALSDQIHVMKDGRLVASLGAREADEDTLHSLMVGRERAADYYHEGRQTKVAAGQKPAFAIRNLSSGDDYQDINLELRAGEIVGIGGLLDSGKAALGRGAAGIEMPSEGTVALSGGPPERPNIASLVPRGLGYVPAERLAEGLIPAFSVAWNMSIASGDVFSSRVGLWRTRQETQVAERYVRELSIRSGAPRQLCSKLSGGNQQKVVLGRWLSRNLTVLILDNPTRGVDAGAKEEIYRFIRDLADRGVAILLITDELLELIGLSNRVCIMQRGRIVAEVPAPAEDKPTERDLVALMLPQASSLTVNNRHLEEPQGSRKVSALAGVVERAA